MSSAVDPTSPHSGRAIRNVSSVSSDHGVSGNAAEAASTPTGKKPAWNFTSNGLIEAGSIIDAVSWPALSESAKFSPKSASSDSPKPVSDASVSAPPGPLASSSPSSKQGLSNQNSGSSQNPLSPARQKSMKRNNSSGSSNGGLTLPSSLQEASQLVKQQPSSGSFSKGIQNKNNSSISNEKDHGSKAGGFSPQPYKGNEHQRGRRGSAGHHNNYGNNNKRDSERGGYEWSHQNLVRDVHMQQPHQQRGVRPFQRPPPVVAAPFIAPPQPLRPFSSHMGFPDFPSPVYYVAAAPPLPESLRGVPFAPQPAPAAPQVMYFPAPDPQRAMLLKQIEYYFSPENLCKDIYLRQNMDEKGWVHISLIAGFNRVKQLTNSVQYILDTIQLSTVVEVQGEKIRKRNDWMTWLLHPADHSSSASGLQSPTTISYEELEGQFHSVCLDLEDAPNNTGLGVSAQKEVVLTRSTSANKIVTCQ